MNPGILIIVLIFAGLLGLVIGSFLNVVVARVPAGVPLVRESRCPTCGDAIRPWQNVPVLSWLALRGRCAQCRESISPRYPLVELVTAIAFIAVTWFFLDAPTFAGIPVIVAYLFLAAISIALTLIDLDTHRLPNPIVLPAYPAMISLFVIAVLLGADPWALVSAAVGGATMFAFYFLLRTIRPAGMGGGDVKLAGILGIALGWLGWSELIVGGFAAFLLGGVFGVVLLATGRAGRKSAIPFGPWMLAGAWIGIFSGEAVARWYLALFTA